MGNQLDISRPLATPTPQLTQSMSLEQLDAHRKAIAFDVEVILDGYWDRRPPADVKAGILSDWCDALEDWSKEQILFVLRDWREKKPSSKPNPGHIVQVLKEMRGKAEAARSLAQPKPAPVVVVDDTPMTPEQRVEHEANLARFIGRREMPRAQSEATTRANINAAKAQLKAAGVVQ